MTVLVIGNCTVDLSFSIPRFPRAGETLLASAKTQDLGGKGANQALVAARFGIATLLAAPIGRDPDGDWACRRLAEAGLDLQAILRTDTSTDQSVIYVTPDGENSIVSSREAAAAATPDWAETFLARHGQRGDILLMQGNLPLDTTQRALAAARAAGIATMLNPAPIQYGCESLFPLTDVVILNEVEAVELGGASDPLRSAMAIHEGGVQEVVVTLGARGAVLIDRQGCHSFPAPVVAAVDTVGAGDTVCGAFSAALAHGLPSDDALRIAIEAAALVVTRRGTQSSFPSSVEAAGILAGRRR